jgi:hypothetical protein
MVRCLSFHQTYRCGRSGRCCTSNWPIPIETDRLARVQAAVASQVIRTRRTGGHWLAEPGPPAILATAQGRCVFHRSDGDEHACAIQTALGHDALPLACRQFPRVSVIDPRGVSVALSTYCPTAAALLDAPGTVSIVDAPPAFPESGEYVGLDARAGWPPMLKPGVLMDWPSWWSFERRAVDLIANRSSSSGAALARLSKVVEHVRAWRVGDEPLEARVAGAFDAASDIPAPDEADDGDRVRELHARIPAAWGVDVRPAVPVVESSTRQLRFLASHAFANWSIHLGDDIRTWLESLRMARAVLSAGFSVGDADLWLRHLTPATGLSDTASPAIDH